LVFRVDSSRYYLVDYKTNRLSTYGPDALREAMYTAHYPLQGLLYAVALHRYLRWRLPAYEPERNLAGVLYLFVRGMSSADPLPAGDATPAVWAWRPPAPLIVALSDLFDRGGDGR
jgi:exodeoxyribonuclease V beta subunit